MCSEFAGAATIDIGATSITLHEAAASSYTNAALNGMQFAGLNFGDGSTLTGSTLTGSTLTTGLPGLTASDITFDGNSIEYIAEGLSFVNSLYTITLGLTTTTGGISSTPGPASVLLFGLATAAFGLWKVRSRRFVF